MLRRHFNSSWQSPEVLQQRSFCRRIVTRHAGSDGPLPRATSLTGASFSLRKMKVYVRDFSPFARTSK
jgi:hypothetical protein